MTPENVRTAADARKIVEERKLDHVKVGVFDNDGVMRGKYMGRDKFFSALDKGFGFCDVVLGWDSNDQLYDNVKYTAGTRPTRMRRCACCRTPVARALRRRHGHVPRRVRRSAEAVCPRASLRRVLKKADDMGYAPSPPPSSSSSCSRRRRSRCARRASAT
jgi:glutamine synthetase